LARRQRGIEQSKPLCTAKTREKVKEIVETIPTVVGAKVVTSVMYVQGGMAYDEGGRTEVETRDPQWAADKAKSYYAGFYFYDVLELTAQLPDGTELTMTSNQFNVSGIYYIDFTEVELDEYASRGDYEAGKADRIRESPCDVGLAERIVGVQSVTVALREGDETIQRSDPG
jgi:hypothetical protein